MFMANMPITATPRTTSSVAMRGGGSVAAVIRLPPTIRRRELQVRWLVATTGRSAFSGLRLELNIILQAHRLDHLELLLERVDMLLLVGEDVAEQVAADIVADILAMLNRLAQLGQRFKLQLHVG